MTTTRDRWVAILAEFEASGLTVAEHCRRHDVSTASFYRWKRLLREAPRPRASFVEAVLSPARRALPTVEAGHWRVAVPEEFDEAALARLLLALERIACEPAEQRR